MKGDNKKKAGRDKLYPNGSEVKSFSISTENLEFIRKNKAYSMSYTINLMLDRLRQEKDFKLIN